MSQSSRSINKFLFHTISWKAKQSLKENLLLLLRRQRNYLSIDQNEIYTYRPSDFNIRSEIWVTVTFQSMSRCRNTKICSQLSLNTRVCPALSHSVLRSCRCRGRARVIIGYSAQKTSSSPVGTWASDVRKKVDLLEITSKHCSSKHCYRIPWKFVRSIYVPTPLPLDKSAGFTGFLVGQALVIVRSTTCKHLSYRAALHQVTGRILVFWCKHNRFLVFHLF
jgi:hypothetical protein